MSLSLVNGGMSAAWPGCTVLTCILRNRTVCTPDYGDCGCDNCKGVFEDISDRMDEFAERSFDNGWDRTKAVWTVPQAFGDDTYVVEIRFDFTYTADIYLTINLSL